MPNAYALRRQLDELKAQTDVKIKQLERDEINLKSFQSFWDNAQSEAEQLRTGLKAYDHAMSYRTGPINMAQAQAWQEGDSYSAPPDVRAKGRAPSLFFTDDEYRQAFDACQMRATCQIGTKDFSSQIATKAAKAGVSDLGYNVGDGGGISGMMPPTLHAIITAQIHEQRLADHLPTIAMPSPAYEYIRHTGTTGAVDVTAEGAVKPEVELTLDKLIVQAVKIAGTTAVSWETLSDYDKFVQYLQAEIPRQIVDKENFELLYGPGGTGQILGLLNTPGVLTHTVSGTNPFDDIEESIAALRVGPSLATPDLLVLNPATWSAVRRTKDQYGRYLVSPDPSKDEVNTAWGVDVIPTTALAAGTGLLIDSTKFGAVLVREALVIRTGTVNDDFTRNLVRFVYEERVTQAVERPTALLKISGLPTTIGGS